MNTTIFSPYGRFSKETGFIYLFARYLSSVGNCVSALECDGAFSMCSRDFEKNWSRSLDTCLMCQAEQNFSASWADIESISISSYLTSEEVKKTKLWIDSILDEDLISCKYEDFKITDYIGEVFNQRFPNQKLDIANTSQTYFYRKMLLSAVRMLHVARGLVKETKSKYFILANSKDYMIPVLNKILKDSHKVVVLVEWDSKQSQMQVKSSHSDRSRSYELFVEDVTKHRREVESWPQVITSTFLDFTDYLGIDTSQMSLPL